MTHSMIPFFEQCKHFQRSRVYTRPIPRDRVQMDVMKVHAKCYQFTAIDDCTHLRAMCLYHSKHEENTVNFLYEVLENFDFPIQRIQTDWGTEFYSHLSLHDKTLSLEQLLADWEYFYNYKNPHSSLSGKKPFERFLELEKDTPIQSEVTGKYWEKMEVIRPRNYQSLNTIKKKNISFVMKYHTLT